MISPAAGISTLIFFFFFRLLIRTDRRRLHNVRSNIYAFFSALVCAGDRKKREEGPVLFGENEVVGKKVQVENEKNGGRKEIRILAD